jgi:RNA polymerase sigma-70 factor, ECF subfamily
MSEADPDPGEPKHIDDQIRAAHDRLLAGDRVASEDLARLVLKPLVDRLKRRWPRWAHTDVLYNAAVDVFLDYLEAPERYDLERKRLLGWLELAAHRDLTNSYRSARQRWSIEQVPLSSIHDPKRPAAERPATELPAGVEPLGMARVGPDPGNAERLDALGLWRRIRQAFPDERERELVWACWVEGERSSDRLAQILGVYHLPVEQRRRRVKDARDVARRKLQRMGLIDDEPD